MKATKKIVGAACALVAAVALSAGTTFAWFAQNSSVNATGMNVTVTQKSPFLIISEGVDTSDVEDTEVEFTTSRTEMLPCTHGNADSSFVSGLKRISNPEVVDKETGLPTSTANYADVSVESESKYYIDYVVYIAAYDTLLNQDLSVNLTHTLVSLSLAQSACSVDFYVGAVAEDNFKGTLNLAGLDPETNDASTAKTSVKLLDNGTIPVRAASGSIQVSMRVYFDGALKKSGTEAYLATTTITAETCATQFGVEFTTVTHSA